MSSGKRAFETKLNILLGRLLSKELGFKAISEYISHANRPDIIIYVNGVKIIVEGSYSKTDAENDVKRRIEEGFGDLGLALFYKEAFPTNLVDSQLEERLRNSSFEVRLIVPEDISGTLLAHFTRKKITPKWITDWIEVKITDLISIINEATQFIIVEEDINQALNEIEQGINDFVLRAKSIDVNKQIAKNLYDLFYKLYGLSVGNYEEIAELIYAKASLAILLSVTFYQSVRAEIGLDDINTFCKQYGYRLGLRKAFEEILKVNYEPIYNLAIQVINVLPDTMDLALKKIVDLGEKCSSKRTLFRRDFSGKIYHKIVGDWALRKNFATYFTSVPAAYLLAYLAVFTRTGVFKEFKNVKVGDLACGSGTLLTAAYNALRDLYIYSRFKEGKVDLREFHKLLLEDNLWGIDALRYAVQIASTNLVLQDPTIRVNCMKTFTVPLGVSNGKVVLGSLEFMEGTSLPSIAMYFTEKPSLKFIEEAESASIMGEEEVPEKIPRFDFIIMNPPFTRATGRGGRERGGLFGFVMDESMRKKILEKYEELRKKIQQNLETLARSGRQHAVISRLGSLTNELYSIGQAGEGLLFLYLASKLITEEGKIAFVLPKSLLTGVSWFLARNLLLEKFHLEHIVLSYDAKNGYNFSESTSLSETLIVARRREKPEDNEETTVTILLKKPSTSLEARALAFKIIRAGKDEYVEVNGARAYVYKFSREELTTNLDNWGKLCAFPSPPLNKLVNEIFSGKLYDRNIPMVLLGEIAEIVGLAVRRGTFHEVFKQVKEKTPEAIPALIGGEEEIRKKISIRPNSWVICKKPRYLSTMSKFLVPDRIWVDTMHALSLYCEKPVVCNMFFGLISKDEIKLSENMLKVLALWLNTSWGILSVLSNRTETRGRWIELTITKWKLQPVLNVTALSEETISRLVEVFEKHRDKDLRRLPDQFRPGDIDPVRKSIDKDFLGALGIEVDENILENMYKLIYENIKAWID